MTDQTHSPLPCPVWRSTMHGRYDLTMRGEVFAAVSHNGGPGRSCAWFVFVEGEEPTQVTRKVEAVAIAEARLIAERKDAGSKTGRVDRRALVAAARAALREADRE